MRGRHRSRVRGMVVICSAVHCFLLAGALFAAEKTLFVTKATASGQAAADFDFLALIPAATLVNNGTPAILAIKAASDFSKNRYLINYLSRYKPVRTFTVNIAATVPNTQLTTPITAASGKALSDTIALRFWKTSEKIVAVKENSYGEALQGAALAACLGVPMVYFANSTDINTIATKLSAREILSVGTSTPTFSIKTTKLTGVVDIVNYLATQGKSVDYFAATNPKDVAIADGPKQSLIAPFLAARRQGIVIPLQNTGSHSSVKKELQGHYFSLKRHPTYLALIGSTKAIPPHYETDEEADPGYTGLEKLLMTDFPYSDSDGDPFPDIAIGRVVTDDIFDVSIYASRVSTYNDLRDGTWDREIAETGAEKSVEASNLYKNCGFKASRSYVQSTAAVLPSSTPIEAGVVLHSSHSFYQLLGEFLDNESENILAPSVMISSGCLVAGIDLGADNVVKRLFKSGAVAFCGAPRDAATQGAQTRATIANRLLQGFSVGEAYREGITSLTLSTLIGNWSNRDRYNLMLLGDPALTISVPKGPAVKPASGALRSDTLTVMVPKTVFSESITQATLSDWGWKGSQLSYPSCPGIEPITYWAGKYDKSEPCFLASVTDKRPVRSIQQLGTVTSPLGKKGAYYHDTLQDGSVRTLWLVRVMDYNHETGKVSSRIDSIRYAVTFDNTVANSAPLAATPSPVDIHYNASSMVLRYTLSRPCEVSLTYFDMRGRRIASLAGTAHGAGSHTLSLRNLFRAKGTYVQIFAAGDFVKRDVIVLAK